MSDSGPARRRGLPREQKTQSPTPGPDSVAEERRSERPNPEAEGTQSSGARRGLPRTGLPTGGTGKTISPEALPPSPSTNASAAGVGAALKKPDTSKPAWWLVTVASLIVGVVVVGLGVVAGRWLSSTEPAVEFLSRYPGEYELPEGAPVGIPAWLAWQHFFNAFFMILIIRSGLTIRLQQKPPAYWTSRRKPGTKVTLTVWFHQSLDLLWLINGVVYFVLLFATGQWVRVIPTSWEVFPNALSALLQYASLDWPTDNGWVNYNSLQQLTYFVTVFVAAPLAAATGFRLSTLWPEKSATLARVYPVTLARALHFPVMWYFAAFTVIHVVLVLSTGALKNLNHMYAAQGSTDPAAYADNWTGFWMFALSVASFVGAWFAAHPVVLSSIARLFGTVTAR